MEVGHGMLFPVSVIDGLVHNFGGMHLDMELKWHRMVKTAKTIGGGGGNGGGVDPCPIGTAVRTTAGRGRLGQEYDTIIHTAPPFYHYPEHANDDTSQQLYECYRNSLNQLLEPHDDHDDDDDDDAKGSLRVATPILGAGCRGFPFDVASGIAGRATRDWCYENKDRDVTIAFGLLEESWARQVVTNLLDE